MKSVEERIADSRKKRKDGTLAATSNVESRIAKSRQERTIGFDTFESDLASASDLVNRVYSGWHSADDMKSSRQTVSAMRDRLTAYRGYANDNSNGQDLTEFNTGMDKLIGAYDDALGDWDTLAAEYARYTDADSYGVAKKNSERYHKYKGLDFDGVQRAIKENPDDAEFLSRYGLNVGYADKKDVEKEIGIVDYYIANSEGAEQKAWKDYRNRLYETTTNQNALFKGSEAFADGYQMGDVLDTVGATAADVVVSGSKGLASGMEGLGDFATYGVAGLAGLVGADGVSQYLKDLAKKDMTGDLYRPYYSTAVHRDSVLGGLGTAVAEGVGQMGFNLSTAMMGSGAGLGKLGTEVVSKGALFSSAAGNSMSEAYNNGATGGEALAYGLLSGTAETLSEMMFGGLGKAVNSIGLNRGIAGFDDMLAKKIGGKINNFVLRNAAEMGIKATGEGVEELVAGLGSAVAKKLTYMSDENLRELIADEDLLNQFLVGTLSSAVTQTPSLVQSYKYGTDYVTDRTAAEEFVISSDFEVRLAEAEKDGKKLSKSEKNKLYRQVEDDLTAEQKKVYESAKRNKPNAVGRMASLDVADTVDNVTGAAIKVQGIRTDDSGNTVLKTSAGERSMDSVTLNRRDAEVVAMAEGMEPSQADLFVSMYSGQDTAAYKDSFDLAYAYGKNAYGVDNAIKRRGVLTEDQALKVYKLGISERTSSQQKQIDAITEKHFADGGKMVEGKFDDTGVDYTKLNSRQKSAASFAKMFSKATGVNVVLFESKADEKGVRKAENGRYESGTNTIYMDVYAGFMESAGVVEDAMIPTLSHELTHWMKEKAPEAYAKLSDIVMDTLSQHHGARPEVLVTVEKKRHKDKGRDVSDEYAQDELIARACEDMLSGNKTAEEIIEKMDAETAKTFSEKFKEIVAKIRAWLKDLLKAYKSNSEEAKILRQYDSKLAELQKAWDEAFAKAVRSNQALRNSENAGVAESRRKYSDRNLFLTSDDIPGYLKAGSRRNIKRIKRYEAGEKIIISNEAELRDFVSKSISGEITGKTVAYGIVSKKLADAVYKESSGKVDVRGYYLELVADDINHSFKEHQEAKKADNLPLSEEDFVTAILRVNSSKLVNVEYHADNSRAIKLCLEGADGNTMLIEVVSVSAGSIKLKTVWKETKRNSANAAGNRNSNPNSKLGSARDASVSKDSIPQNAGNIKENVKEEIVQYADRVKPSMDLQETIEQTDGMIAVHNLSEEKLLKAFRLGGFPMPSIAVTRASIGHKGFGNISLLFRKDTIDPKRFRGNKVYSGDAWTPMYPSVSHKLNKAVQKKVENKIDSLLSYDMQRQLGNLHLDADNMTDALDKSGGDLVDYYKNNNVMRYAFLVDSGKTLELPQRTAKLDPRFDNDLVVRVAEKYGEDMIYQYNHGEYTDRGTLISGVRDLANEYAIEKYGTVKALKKKLETSPMYTVENFGFAQTDSILRAALKYFDKGITTQIDSYAAGDVIRDNTNQEEYEAWLSELFDGAVEKTGIRNNKGVFTPRGDRRSWDVLHYEETLENVVRVMKEEDEKGSGVLGGNIFGASTVEFGTIDDIKEAGKKLRTMSHDEWVDTKQEFQSRFTELAETLPYSKDFIAADSAAETMVEAVAKYRTRDGIAWYLKKEFEGWARYSEQVVDELIELVNDIRNMPVNYFEAKPRRAVGFDEVAYAVIPDNTSEKVRKALAEHGIETVEYAANDEDARVAAVNSVEGVQFSTRDSEGNGLTPEQVEFFKESKVRDEKGNLLVMYHGTPNAGFTVFRSGTYFTEHKDYADVYQNQGASSLGYKKTADNPGTYAVYLNIKKPFDTRNKVERDIFYNEYYRKYGMGTDLMESGLPDWMDGMDLQEFLEENGYDYDGLILDEGGVGGYGDEVKSRGLSYVVFSANQVKDITNQNPTENEDIRRSDRDSEGNGLTKEQIEFFAESKARDDEGNLLVLYHGTQEATFHSFNTDTIFLTTSPRVAKAYTSDDGYIPKFVDEGKGNIYRLYADIKNPLIVDAANHITGKYDVEILYYMNTDKYSLTFTNGTETFTRTGYGREFIHSMFAEKDAEAIVSKAESMEPKGLYSPVKFNRKGKNIDITDPNVYTDIVYNGKTMSADEIAEIAKKEGYDGVIINNVIDDLSFSKNGISATDVIVFSSNQLKRIDNENPTSDSDIRFSDRDIDSWLDDLDIEDIIDDITGYFFEDSGKKARAPRRVDAVNKRLKAIGLSFNGTKSLAWTDERIEKYLSGGWYGSSNPEYAQAYIAYVTPQQFLNLTAGSNTATLDRIENENKEYGELNISKLGEVPMFLDIHEGMNGAKVTGHEGRHRMYLLGKAGFEKVPVLLFDYRTKYSKTAKGSLKLTAQRFNDKDFISKTRDVVLTDVIPFSNGNKDLIIKKFGSGAEADVHYSERQTESIYDAVGELKRIQRENDKLKADIERLRKKNRLERTVTGGRELNESHIAAVAGRVLKLADSRYSREDLADELKVIYEYLQGEDVAWDVFMSKATDLAQRVVAEARERKVTDDYAKMILSTIRSARISLNDTQKAEAEYAYGKNWNRSFFGRVTIANDGIPLESVWSEWAAMYPDVFDADISDADMVTALLDIYDSTRTASEVVETYDKSEAARALAFEIYNQFWNVAPVRTLADKHDKEVKRLKFEHRQDMKELREKTDKKVFETQWHYSKLIHEVREARDEKIAQLKKESHEYTKQYREKIERRNQISQITKKSLKLNTWLKKNSKDEHIVEDLKEPVKAVLRALDFSSERLLGTGVPTQKDISLKEAFAHLHDSLRDIETEQLKKAKDNDAEYDIDMPADYVEFVKEIKDQVDGIVDKVGDNEYVLRDMTVEQLQDVNKMLTVLSHIVTSANKALADANGKAISTMAQSTMLYANDLGPKSKKVGAASDFFNFDNGLPVYVFKMMGEGGQRIFRNMQDGWDKMAFHVKQIVDYSKDCYDAKEVKEWSKEIHEFSFEDGSTVQMTTAQIMSLYCLQKREQARQHLVQGGMRIADFKIGMDKITNEDGVLLLPHEIDKVVSTLTNRQKTVADALQTFMNTVCSDWGNEVSMRRFGIKSFGEENYFPIQSDASIVTGEDTPKADNGSDVFRLLNMGFTNGLNLKANNRIVVDNIFDVFATHTSDMAKYNALALPVLDMFRWYSYKESYRINPDDPKDTRTRAKSLKQSLKKAYGDGSTKYIYQFMKDINGAHSGGMSNIEKLGRKMISNYKVAAVGANIRVAILQPTSYVRASAVIDPKYLAAALAHKPQIQKAKDTCGIALWKSLGFYDTNISRGVASLIKHDERWYHKAREYSMKLAEWGDAMTWGYLYNACEAEIKATQPGLTGEEKDRAVADRLREVIYATQVVDSTMTRTQNMRNPSTMNQIMTSFMSEPSLSYNLLHDLYIQYNADKRQIGKNAAFRKNGKHIARVTASYLVTLCCASLAGGFIDTIRDDEDEEEFFEKLLSNAAENAVSDALSMLPVIKDAVSIYKGFNVGRMDMQGIQSSYYAFRKLYKAFSEGEWDYKTVYSLINSVTKAVSQNSGLPASNLLRDVIAIWNNTIGEVFESVKVKEK